MTGLRIVAIAVTVLIVIDPLLVWSTGFRLSVGASLSLVLLARPLARALPGPRWIAEPLAVTLAAQVGTAPILVAMAGSVPVLGPVWNLVAVPVAGLLMAFGVVAAPVAGLAAGRPVGSVLGALVEIPAELMCSWLSGVARVGADGSWPRVGQVGTWAMVIATLLAAWWGARSPPGGRSWAMSTAGVTGVASGVTARRRSSSIVAVVLIVVMMWDLLLGRPIGQVVDRADVRVWVADDSIVVVVGSRSSESSVLAAVLAARVQRVDLVIVLGGGRLTSGAVWSLREVMEVTTVLAVDPSAVRDAGALVPGDIKIGSLAVRVARTGTGAWRVESAA